MSEEKSLYGIMLFDVKTLEFQVLNHQLDEEAAGKERARLRSEGKPVYLFINKPENWNGGHAPHSKAETCPACKGEAETVVYDMTRRVGNEKHQKKRGY